MPTDRSPHDDEREAARRRLAQSLGHLIAAEWARRRSHQAKAALGASAVGAEPSNLVEPGGVGART